MSEIVLTGIRGDLPIGAMAAFGLLRVCTEQLGMCSARLHWRRTEGAWRGVLGSDEELQTVDLITRLAENAGTVDRRYELNWREHLKSVSVPEYRAAAQDERTTSIDWFAAFGTEIVMDEDSISRTPLDMTVARQKLLADVMKLARSLSGDIAAFREALFGPWRYADDQHSLGWDPTTMRLGAFTTQAPTGMPNAGVRAAVWLAFESLPLFPCFCANGTLNTRGLLRTRNSFEFRWPMWSQPISLQTLKSLLACTELYEKDDLVALFARGVIEVYSAERFKPNKYMIGFRSSVLVAGSS